MMSCWVRLVIFVDDGLSFHDRLISDIYLGLVAVKEDKVYVTSMELIVVGDDEHLFHVQEFDLPV